MDFTLTTFDDPTLKAPVLHARKLVTAIEN